MNRFQHIRTATVLMVMGIMSISWFITGAMLFLLKIFGFFRHLIQWTPIILTMSMFGVSLIVGTMLAFVIVKHFLKPLHQLIDANKKIASGDFSVRMSEENYPEGEMYDLLHSFNLMAGELESIELYRSDFINNFSHEFKTPIVSVRGFAKQLKNPDLTPEQRDEYLDIIINESEKLCNMSGNVLQMTKLENQNIVGDRTRFSLDEQIRHSVLLLERQWSSKSIELSLDLPAVEIFNNADMLAQVWKNLLENAIKFTPNNGTVGVRMAQQDKFISVEVFDTGCGMSEETLKHVFEKFYQGDSSHSKEGNGLGLSIVKRIVELCGGTVSVTSALDRGSVFTVTLPTGVSEQSK